MQILDSWTMLVNNPITIGVIAFIGSAITVIGVFWLIGILFQGEDFDVLWMFLLVVGGSVCCGSYDMYKNNYELQYHKVIVEDRKSVV